MVKLYGEALLDLLINPPSTRPAGEAAATQPGDEGGAGAEPSSK